jgi:hypothetical protein
MGRIALIKASMAEEGLGGWHTLPLVRIRIDRMKGCAG